jgi:hypothetical protein
MYVCGSAVLAVLLDSVGAASEEVVVRGSVLEGLAPEFVQLLVGRREVR